MNQEVNKQPRHWIDGLTSDLIQYWPDIQIFNCNSGLSVSGLVHVGNLRGEIILTNAVLTELQTRGYDGVHNLIVYTSDPWKGKQTQLNLYPDPKKAKNYINWRLIDVPAPNNNEQSWVDYFWKDFDDPLQKFGRDVHIIKTHELYQEQRMKTVIKDLIGKKDEIRRVLNKYRKEKPFPEEWIPINPLCEHCNRIGTTKALEVNIKTFQVHYFCEECQNDGWSDISKGKLSWRLEWIAIWKVLNIHFEPYGKDLATPGGARDSGIEVSETVLKHKGPYGFWNEWVGYSEGKKDFGDMTGSGLIGFTPTKWLEFAEPEVLKYMYLKIPPKRRIVLGLDKIPSYVSDYDRAQRIYYGEEEFEDPSELHAIKRSYEITFFNDVPDYKGFQLDYHNAIILSQLVSPDQKGTAQAIEKLIESDILKQKPTKQIKEHIHNRLSLARNWVSSTYAPEHLRIQLKEQISPEILRQLDEKRIQLILELGKILKAANWTEEEIKQKMMSLREKEELSRKQMNSFFQALYQIFLGSTRGPRFAPFIAALDKDWVINRLQEVNTS